MKCGSCIIIKTRNEARRLTRSADHKRAARDSDNGEAMLSASNGAGSVGGTHGKNHFDRLEDFEHSVTKSNTAGKLMSPFGYINFVHDLSRSIGFVDCSSLHYK